MFWLKSKENLTLKIIALLTFGIMVICNMLANTLPINGITTGMVSELYPNLFTPIGFSFAIWGVIYTLLVIFCLFQFSRLRTKKSHVSEKTLNALLPYFIASSILNSAWIFAWHYQQIGLSVILIITIFICLMQIVSILKEQSYAFKDYVWLRLPFSVYFGWITVAVIANIAVWLVSIGWDGWGLEESFWTIVFLVIGGIVGVINNEKNKDLAYLIVIIWAYSGILIKHLASSGFNGIYENIIVVLVLLLGIFVYKAYVYADQLLRRNK